MYFALKDIDDLVKDLGKKKTNFDLFLKDTGRQLLYNTLYRGFYQGKYHCGQLYTTGENGEFMNINVNEFRSNIQHIKSLITSQKITLKPAASTTDVAALSQALLGQNVMAHYSRQLKLDLVMDEMLDDGILYADCYVVLGWDENLGRPLITNQFGRKVYEGDAYVQVFPPHMVPIDPVNPNSQWHILQYKVNKFDLAALYPDKADEIERIQLSENYFFDAQMANTKMKYSEEAIYVYKFVHMDTHLVPGGRETLYINDKLWLKDGSLSTPFYPVTRFQVSKVEDTPFGYSPTFDSVQLTSTNNKLFSTMVTNESKFGVQLVLSPKGADLDVNDVVDGAKFIEYDPAAGIPTALNLLATSEKTFELSQLLTQKNDQTMGLSDVTKGQAPKDIESGNALALLQSMTVQFNSTMQKNFVLSLEEFGGKLFQLLQVKVTNERLLEIVGQDQEQYTQAWTGEGIKGINKCVVELGDPAKDTVVGRQEMADNLLQYGDISTDQYFTIRETGSPGVIINRKVSHEMLIQRENEMMMKGMKPIMVKSDHHINHHESHACLLDRPEVRSNPQIAQIIIEHQLEHENMEKMLLATDPTFLIMTGQAPTPEMMMSMAPQMPPPQEKNGKQKLPSQPTNPLSGEKFNTVNGGLNVNQQ